MRYLPSLTAVILLGWVVACATGFHVSPAGNDANPGTREEPLATLMGARDAVRKFKQAGPLGEAVTIHVRAGTYTLEQPVKFTQGDSGTTNASINYLAERGAVVRLTGGREVAGWKPAADGAVLSRLPAEARGQVLVADLHEQNLTDYGKLALRGFGADSPPAEAEVFYDDEPMTLARWPNSGFRGAKAKENDLMVIVDTDRVGRWSAESEPWVFADWAELYEPLAGVDASKPALLRTPQVKPAYGITPDRVRWYVLNLLSELDTPGEYYLDRVSGRLYFWPPRAGGRAVLSVAEGLIQAENLPHVTFRGFTIEACRGTVITLQGGTDCRIVGCTIRNTGHRAVQVTEGARHEVFGCDVYHSGEGGIALSGGQRPTLTPAGHNAENNHVHHRHEQSDLRQRSRLGATGQRRGRSSTTIDFQGHRGRQGHWLRAAATREDGAVRGRTPRQLAGAPGCPADSISPGHDPTEMTPGITPLSRES